MEFDHQVTSATEHCRPAATEHCRQALSANVVFIDIAWKLSRMNNKLNKNMEGLVNTITGVVRNMNTTMICMCEVGETTKSFERGADATVRNPSHKRMDGCCYRGHPATQHVYHRDPIRDDLHTWSHTRLRPADSGEPVLCRRISSHSTNIWVLFSLW